MIPDRLRLAAKHLRETAQSLAESEGTGVGLWPPDENAQRAQRDHNEMIDLARELQSEAAGIEAGPREPARIIPQDYRGLLLVYNQLVSDYEKLRERLRGQA